MTRDGGAQRPQIEPRLFRALADLRLDLTQLRSEVNELLATVPLAFERTRQVALQSRSGSSDPWYESCRRQDEIADDRLYTVLNAELRGTYLDTVLRSLPFEPFRTRIMTLAAATCYSVHRDETARFHVAITTSNQAHFVFVTQQRVVHVPADGRVYFVDTRELHSAFNGASEERIHIVIGGETS